jgi:outer membrane protein OmpA-like peptidoglycan-associated protein
MASALLNQLSEEFGSDTINRIATSIGESPGKIKAALADMLPVLLGGLASKAQTDEGAHELLDVIHRDHLDTERYEHVSEAIKEPGSLGTLIHTGEPLLDTVLPGKSNVVSDWVASNSGINPSSSKSLMSLALPLVLGLIGRRVGNDGESGLKSLLGKPLGFLQDAPAGLASIIGMGTAAAASTASARRAGFKPVGQGAMHTSESDAAPSSKWLWWIIALLAVIALLWFYLIRRGPEPLTPPPTANAELPTMPSPLAPTAPIAPLTASGPGEFIDKSLPNGTTLHIPANGVENKLLAFIEDQSAQVNPDTWFSFDRLAFETNSATLKPSSQEQIHNIAEIMKAYPQVKLKIGGYTDNTGNPQQNLKLSRDRAATAMDQIAASGIDISRMSAQGYGDQHPVADNATAGGREKNRRVDVNVAAK